LFNSFFVKFVVDKGLTDKTEIFVETKSRNMRIKKMAENAYCVNVGLPIFTPKDIPFNQLKSENATYTVDGYQVGVVSMGNPHAVLIVNNINQEIESIAKKIQNSEDFPNGVNVNKNRQPYIYTISIFSHFSYSHVAIFSFNKNFCFIC
jgi:diaminopimelate epimerase